MIPKLLSLGLLLYTTHTAYIDIRKLHHDKKEVLIAFLILVSVYDLGYWTGRS